MKGGLKEDQSGPLVYLFSRAGMVDNDEREKMRELNKRFAFGILQSHF